MRVSDPFNAWLGDCCLFLSEAYLTRQEAYNNYRDYSDELGAEPDNTKSFYQKMRQTPKIKDTQIRIDGKRERVFQGITFKTDNEEDKEQKKLETVTTVTDITGCTSRKYVESGNKERGMSPVTGVTPVTPSVNIGKAFNDTCSFCGKKFDEYSPYTFYKSEKIHIKCLNEYEAQEEAKIRGFCQHSKEDNGRFVCALSDFGFENRCTLDDMKDCPELESAQTNLPLSSLEC